MTPPHGVFALLKQTGVGHKGWDKKAPLSLRLVNWWETFSASIASQGLRVVTKGVLKRASAFSHTLGVCVRGEAERSYSLNK
jgi:hypothetical protein